MQHHAPARYATFHYSEAEASVKVFVSLRVRFKMLMNVKFPFTNSGFVFSFVQQGIALRMLFHVVSVSLSINA